MLFFLKARWTFITSTSSSSTSKMFSVLISCMVVRSSLSFWPKEPKGGASTLRGLHPGSSPPALDDLLHHRQSDPRPLDAISRLQRLKNAPDLLVVRRIDPW